MSFRSTISFTDQQAGRSTVTPGPGGSSELDDRPTEGSREALLGPSAPPCFLSAAIGRGSWGVEGGGEAAASVSLKLTTTTTTFYTHSHLPLLNQEAPFSPLKGEAPFRGGSTFHSGINSQQLKC